METQAIVTILIPLVAKAMVLLDLIRNMVILYLVTGLLALVCSIYIGIYTLRGFR